MLFIRFLHFKSDPDPLHNIAQQRPQPAQLLRLGGGLQRDAQRLKINFQPCNFLHQCRDRAAKTRQGLRYFAVRGVYAHMVFASFRLALRPARRLASRKTSSPHFKASVAKSTRKETDPSGERSG